MLEVISHEPEKHLHINPILFVHGAWHGAWCWDEWFLPYFAAKGWQVHALSLRGHGKSSGQDKIRWHSIGNYVEDVAEVANGLPQTPIVIGHSMGGLVVQKYLETHYAPAGVLIASVPPSGVFRTTLNVIRHYPLQFLKTNLTLSMYPLVGSETLTQEFFFSQEMPKENVQTYFKQIGNESYRAFLDMLVFGLPKPKRVQTPMLVMGGTKDAIFTVEEVKATAVAYNTQARIFGMAHDMMLEDGWLAVADEIIDWLESQEL